MGGEQGRPCIVLSRVMGSFPPGALGGGRAVELGRAGWQHGRAGWRHSGVGQWPASRLSNERQKALGSGGGTAR
jgi:hypothetical protein